MEGHWNLRFNSFLKILHPNWFKNSVEGMNVETFYDKFSEKEEKNPNKSLGPLSK